MIPSLVEFPTELLYIICTSFCYHCQLKCSCSRSLSIWNHRETLQNEILGFKALRHLCLVNKLLRSVAQPLLYHHLSPFYWDWRHRRSPLLLPFLRTISQVPSLADNIRELDVRYILAVETRDHRLPSLLRSLAFTFPDKKNRKSDDSTESDLGNHLINSLLCLAPNLETVCLGILPGWNFPLMAATGADHLHGEQRHALQCLKTLSLTGPAVRQDPSAFDGIDNLLASAPNLRNLRLQELTYSPPSHLLRNIRRLELDHVPLCSGAHLRHMLQDCTELEEFHYTGPTLDADTTAEMGGGPFGSELLDALAPARPTLRCLEVRYAPQHLAPCIKNTHPAIASLKPFARLQRINLSTGLGVPVAIAKQHQFFALGAQTSCFADLLPASVTVFCPPCWPESILALGASVRRSSNNNNNDDDNTSSEERRDFLPHLERVELEHGLANVDALSRSRSWTRRRSDLQRAFVGSGVDVNFAQDRISSVHSQWHVEG